MPVSLRSGQRVSYTKISAIRLLLVCCLWLTGGSLAGAVEESGAASEQPQVVIKTNLGDIIFELNPNKAPVTVANFLGLVESGAYDNTIFHRVIEGFMVQAGGYDPDLAEAGEAPPIRNEADNGLKNIRGSVAMARMNEIDSASRQFFINVEDNNHLNHNPKKSCTREDEATAAAARAKGMFRPQRCKNFGYAVFARVIEGMDVVDQIERSKTRSMAGFDDVPVSPVVISSVTRR